MSEKPSTVSHEFEEAFNSNSWGRTRRCQCGRTYFDGFNHYDYWAWDKELKRLRSDQRNYPDRFFEVSHAVGSMMIDGQHVVFDCKCGIAARYERFILRHRRQIAQYFFNTLDQSD